MHLGKFIASALVALLATHPIVANANQGEGFEDRGDRFDRTQLKSKKKNPEIAAMAKLKKSKKRWIEIKLRSQTLVAWEGNRPVYASVVSTGKHPKITPTGTFAIQTKHRTARMQGDDYDFPKVPYVMYYHGDYGIHGADWHNLFGLPVTHGCTNLPVEPARWLFSWAAIGTPIVVHRMG